MLPEFTEDILDAVEDGATSWETAKTKAGTKPEKKDGFDFSHAKDCHCFVCRKRGEGRISA